MLWAEERLAHAIADNATHPWRQYLADVTQTLAYGDVLPAQSDNNLPIIGQWGAVRDSSTSEVCSLMPMAQIRRRVTNPNTNLVCSVYWYNISGGRVFHTRTNVTIDCCAYSRTVQSTELNNNGIIALADVLEPAYVAGAVSHLVRDDEFMGQAQAYAAYFNKTIEAIGQGMTSVVPAMEALSAN